MWHNSLQPPWHSPKSIWCWMMTGVLYMAWQVTLVKNASMHSVIIATALATLPRTVQKIFPHQEHYGTMTGHTPDDFTTTIIGTDHSPWFTDLTKEDVLTSQDHTTNPTMTEAHATIRVLHPNPTPRPQQLMIPINQKTLYVTLLMRHTTLTQSQLIYDMPLFCLESLLRLLYGPKPI